MNLIFFASGFAGLIYESIWTHYLKLFLGHAAYAQTLVLGIFMGGMAIGAALAARWTDRIPRPLAAYAAVEGVIGLLAIAFHPVFTTATEAFYAFALDRGLAGTPFLALKWSLAALLILPQSILLGATFPLFAAAATRFSTSGPGRPVATLYFANSLGGAVGVLASGFLLIPGLGLPGTISAAGAMNLAIAAVAVRLAASPARREMPPALPAAPGFGRTAWFLVAVSCLTGASSFIYEIGWIRMLSLVLGSATHAFELMLAAFITGLALGGLWVRKRIDGAANPGALLGYVQLAMGCAAVATLPLHSATFDLIAWVVRSAPRTDAGYALLNLVRYGIAALIMFPAAFCAGMTLPLATRVLHAEERQGERAIGFIYSANTVGAIAGLAFAVHVGLPVLGLEYLVASGALVDVLLGVALLLVFAGRAKLMQGVAATVACLAGTAAAAATFNPQKIVSGPIRTGQAGIEGSVTQVAHGRTATISVETKGSRVTIRTNGKTDASARIHSPVDYEMDEVTMTLAAAMPLMLHEHPGRVANIGFGSGITGEVLLSDPRVNRLDNIEIEPRMVDLARHFGNLNRRVYEDPRSTIHIDDAKSFFASHGQTYDLIVSEPSNPWVSGVSGLFSVEFYRHVSRYLNRDGLFAQWIQIYETHPDRVVSIMKALDQSFDDYLVIALDYGDILVVARPGGRIALPENGYARLSPETRRMLGRIEIAGQADLTFRIIGNKALFKPWLDARPVPANSDFAPYLDAHADYDRFLGKGWPEIYDPALSAYPIADLLGSRPALDGRSALSINRHFGAEPPQAVARLVREALLGEARGPQTLPVPPAARAAFLRQSLQLITDCQHPPRGDHGYAAAALAIKVLPYLSREEGLGVLAALKGESCLAGPDGTPSPWSHLLRQVAERDFLGFGETAEALLRNGQGATEIRTRYLLGMAMLGRLAAGEKAQARRLWETYGGQASTGRSASLSLELLRDHAFSPT